MERFNSSFIHSPDIYWDLFEDAEFERDGWERPRLGDTKIQ